MHPTDLWHQLHLPRPQVAWLCLIAILLAVSAQAQRNKPINLENYEKAHRLRYGFQLGAFNSIMSVDSELRDDTLSLVRAAHSPGFLLGFILNINFDDELWSFRLLPNISFYERQVEYFYRTGEREVQIVDMAMIEIPMVFKYRSLRRRNHRMYLIGGFNFNIQAGGAAQDVRNLSIRRNNAEITYGFGIDLYNTYFKLAPEIRFAHGLVNLHQEAANLYNRNISGMYTHRVSLVFNFE